MGWGQTNLFDPCKKRGGLAQSTANADLCRRALRGVGQPAYPPLVATSEKQYSGITTILISFFSVLIVFIYTHIVFYFFLHIYFALCNNICIFNSILYSFLVIILFIIILFRNFVINYLFIISHIMICIIIIII